MAKAQENIPTGKTEKKKLIAHQSQVDEKAETNEGVESDSTIDEEEIRLQENDGKKSVTDEDKLQKIKETLGITDDKELDQLIESFKQNDIKDEDLLLKKKTKCEGTPIGAGSEISFQRTGYKHHAVVVGNDLETGIVEYVHLTGTISDSVSGICTSGSAGGKAKAEETTTDIKAIDYVYEYPPEITLYTPSIIALRARLLMKKFLYFEKHVGNLYSLFTFNCHHFACFCVTGRIHSRKLNALQSSAKKTNIDKLEKDLNAVARELLEYKKVVEPQ